MPRDGSKTRQRILDAANRLVIERGFAATSVDHVLAAAMTSKGAFFHHFDSKQALAEALVEQYVAADLQMLDDGIAAAQAASRAAGDDPRVAALAFIDHYVDLADEIMAGTTGCLYTSILAEQQLIDNGISEPITRAVLTWRERYADLLTAALPTGAEVDVDALSDHVFVTFEGAFLIARSLGDPAQLRHQLAIVRRLVAALLDTVPRSRT